MATGPSARPTSTKPPTPSQLATMMAARKASRRSAARATSGTAIKRATIGAASTRPIICGSSPLAFSQTGKNGNWMPAMINRPA